MKTFSKISNANTILFPEIIESRRDNDTFTYLANSKELERYYNVLISLYPITDPRLLSATARLKNKIDSLWRNNGAKYTVEYLKEANRLFQFYVAGNPQRSESNLRVGAPGGLPLIIPHIYRGLFAKTEHREYQNVVRIVFALLGCYRLIRYPGVLKLETIVDTSESKGINPWELGYNLSLKFKSIFDKTNIESYSYNLLSLTTAGPNNRISILSAPFDVLALRGTVFEEYLKELSSYFKLGVYTLFKEESELLSVIQDSSRKGLQGKLSIKEEPAGKRRVFAIVDIWTQSVLKPIHDHVFSILKLIPQDGAFDQIKPVKQLISTNQEGKTFCFDLSAATDRFPISVQVDVLSFLYNRSVANAWKGILIDRDYYLRETNQSYRYGTGQPMGALSSWGVFSLCHHLIVQIAATRVGITKWFTEYALLGDDIVITNEVVADMYFKIMTEELHVSINKSKSLQSAQGVMEFAKRIIGPKGDFSPVGPKNVSLFLANKLHIPNLLVDLREKGVGINYSFVKSFLYKLKNKSIFKFTWLEIEALIWSLTKPFGFLDGNRTMPVKWYRKIKPLKANEVLIELSEYFKEEWSLKRDKALASCKECIDKYEGWVVLDNSFFSSMLVPSLREQKLKLIEEYFRLSNLEFPKITVTVVKPSRSALIQSYRLGLPDPTDSIWVELFDKENNKINSTVYNVTSPEYIIHHAILFLSENLPTVNPMTSIYADLMVNRRSLRHVSYKFLKKFMNFRTNMVRKDVIKD